MNIEAEVSYAAHGLRIQSEMAANVLELAGKTIWPSYPSLAREMLFRAEELRISTDTYEAAKN